MASDGETPAGLTRKSSRNQLEDALEVDVNDLQTLGTFIINTAKDEDTSDLSILIQSIGTSCKYIANCVRKLGLAKLAGKAGTENVQGEEQMKLDLVAHEVFSRGLDRSGRCTVMVSEEVEETISCATSPHGRYVCVYDPLDGSSNIDCSVSIGSIFGIYKAATRGVRDDADALQPGKDMVAAGYALYGSACNLVLTIGGCVYGFTLDSSLGEFVLTHPRITVPPRRRHLLGQRGQLQVLGPGVQGVRGAREDGGGPAAEPAVHREHGRGRAPHAAVRRDVFVPARREEPGREAAAPVRVLPMAYVMEKAGGAASDGARRILDIEPKHIHQRSPIHMGSAQDVETIEKFLRESRAE